MVSCKIIQSVLEVLAEISMPCYSPQLPQTLLSWFKISCHISMNISEDKVRQASLHLSWVLSSNRPLEMLFKERHRPKQSGSGEETRVYAYFGLEVLDSATFEPPAKVQHSEVGDTTYEHSITDQLQHRIKELEKQLRTETKAKHQLEEN